MLGMHNIFVDSLPSGSGSTISVDAAAAISVTSMYDDVITSASAPRLVEQCQTEQGCTLFTVIVYVFIQGIMFVLGFIGNTLSFLVLSSDRKSHAATFLLQVSEDTSLRGGGCGRGRRFVGGKNADRNDGTDN